MRYNRRVRTSRVEGGDGFFVFSTEGHPVYVGFLRTLPLLRAWDMLLTPNHVDGSAE